MAGTLVLGYDDSDCAKAALAEALRLAGASGDRLIIAFAYEPPGRMGEELREHREAAREVGERATAPALEQAREAGVDASVELVAKRPAEALVALADDADARMIVVGTWSESALKSAILGSTPHKLLQLSRRPVLVVPA